MRLTVHLDTFGHDTPSAYAIVWLDTGERKWSCEGHADMRLPGWGVLSTAGRDVRLAAPDAGHPLFVLAGFLEADGTPPATGAAGEARWCRHAHHAPTVGRWHLQCVDKTAVDAEHRLFADDES
ncbi:DUF3564 family protein [Burkholderia pseudomultivorans]|uniref:DUF3564 domain-containing protein n=1 Tax=Burkholderia pseudomultivorans TaxID=1207504 RepID=A0A6P2MBD2_9BURK|nr:DUF3564 family protein [Burkholderia pseudomultivorans]MDR8727952.1 hypothetical protein [Burkholderia pseudomultivorans]MDR8734063.1 hypothetical protein [Burkholderia pseudomultivorans]MDR8743711.1 hypothetical protein [Burkholderia pseudomultivorans]MDR8757828.1 hypothetical protein [Burkholderia pseudomultivorans]MDR8779747.1 hypothetical protein [Burkholderia pseudomultivorans]